MPRAVVIEGKPGEAPVETYDLSAGQTLEPLALTAVFDGTGASGDFFPAVSMYAQNGTLLGRFEGKEAITAGTTSEVTFFPFAAPASSGGSGGSGIQFDVDNIGDWLQIDTSGERQPGTAGWEIDSFEGYNWNSDAGPWIVFATEDSSLTIVASYGISASNVDIEATNSTVRLGSPDIVRLDCQRIFLNFGTELDLGGVAVFFPFIPTSAPAGSRQLWDNGGVINITP